MAAEILPALRPEIHRLFETETRVNESVVNGHDCSEL